MRGLFPGTLVQPSESNNLRLLSAFVTLTLAHEYSRASHRLRISASHEGPANPAVINIEQEPLVFRRQSLSLCLSLLMSAFSLPIPPANLTVDLRRLTERSATAHSFHAVNP